MISLDFFPTYCGSSFENKGVQLKCSTQLPTTSPARQMSLHNSEVDAEGNETGELAVVDPDRPLRAGRFKIMADKYGALTFTALIQEGRPRVCVCTQHFHR